MSSPAGRGLRRTERIASVDAIRLLAIVAVISLHTVPFGGQGRGSQPPFVPGEPGWLLNQLARFAVPFFFVVSGYFWSRKVQRGAAPYAAAPALVKRSLLIFAAWSLIYLLPFDTAGIPEKGWLGPLKGKFWDLVYMWDHPLRTLLQGTEMHLWLNSPFALAQL